MRTAQEPTPQPWLTCPPKGPLLRPEAICMRLSISRSQLYELLKLGELPPLIKVSSRVSAMPESWLDAVVEERARRALGVSEN